VLFLDSVEKVNTVLVRDTLVPVLPLITPAVRVTVANVPPFIKEEALVKELVRHGKVVSQVRMVPSGMKSPLLQHVASHRRQLLMVVSNRGEELNLKVNIKVEGYDYPVSVTSGNMKCFVCG